MKYKNTGAVVILYFPDNDLVSVLIDKLLNDVGIVYLIDNTPHVINDFFVGVSKRKEGTLIYLPLNKNLGIAEALNIGIKKVLYKSFKEFVILFDQDSIPDSDMIGNLLDAHTKIYNMGINIAAVGPLAINRDTNKAYKPRVFKGKYISNNIIEKREIISSGSLIHRSAIEAVGYMDSEMFIDGVDFEWCWRASNKGYNSFLCEESLLEHKLGEFDRKFMGFNIAIPSPIRCFYQYRNYLKLLRINYVPLSWKLINFFKYLVKLFYYPIFLKEKSMYVNNIYNGIRAGFKGN
jgi:rhamnosyltransferase